MVGLDTAALRKGAVLWRLLNLLQDGLYMGPRTLPDSSLQRLVCRSCLYHIVAGLPEAGSEWRLRFE